MTKRIAMWSGPRNISTTMMRSFENRPDCAVNDEPFYAFYLHATGIVHPMQEEILRAQPVNWQLVVKDLTGADPAPVYFQKHMCHHITEDLPLDWLGALDHFFLIRDPVRIIASYADRMEKVTPEGLGLAKQAELYRLVTEMTGTPPPVLDAQDVLANPRTALTTLCGRLDIPFMDEMLTWPAGPRDSDGAWAPHWYKSVESSTGFRPPETRDVNLSDDLQEVADACQPHYDFLKAHTIS